MGDAADGRVTIENMKGRVTVRTWDQPRVRITGSLGEGVEKLDIDGGNQALSIHVRYPETGGWFSRDRSGPTMLEVTLPGFVDRALREHGGGQQQAGQADQVFHRRSPRNFFGQPVTARCVSVTRRA